MIYSRTRLLLSSQSWLYTDFSGKGRARLIRKSLNPSADSFFHFFALSAVKNAQTKVSTTGKCFLNVLAPAHLIDLRSVCTQLCPAYEIYISKKAVLYFGLVIRLLSVNKNVSFQWAGNSKEIGFFFPPFSQWCTHSKANVNMRLTSLRWETDPVRWTQTCASKYRRLGRAFASARITASMNRYWT